MLKAWKVDESALKSVFSLKEALLLLIMSLYPVYNFTFALHTVGSVGMNSCS